MSCPGKYPIFFMDQKGRGYGVVSQHNKGEKWYTGKLSGIWSNLPRLWRRDLPIRTSELEALKDLALYAKRKGWIAVGNKNTKEILNWRD